MVVGVPKARMHLLGQVVYMVAMSRVEEVAHLLLVHPYGTKKSTTYGSQVVVILVAKLVSVTVKRIISWENIQT